MSNKEDKVFPIIIFLTLVLGFGLLLYLIYKNIPTKEGIIEELKLCRDNGFDTYQALNGHYYCKPSSDK